MKLKSNKFLNLFKKVRIKLVKFSKGKYIAHYLGSPNINCHVDAVHSINPQGEINTKKLVLEILKNTNCSGIYALISRTEMDLNRPLDEINKPAILEYREAILSILKHLKILDSSNKVIKPYLHLALHGMRNFADKEIEIGTRNNQTCSNEVFQWFSKELKKNCNEVFKKDLKIVYNKEFIGDKSKEIHREKYGHLFNTFQIEINKILRTQYFSETVEVLTRIVKNFHKKIYYELV